jgi:hypothetical protein
MLVKIVKCSKDSYWYYPLVGCHIDVENNLNDNTEYTTKMGLVFDEGCSYCIKKEDTEVLDLK